MATATAKIALTIVVITKRSRVLTRIELNSQLTPAFAGSRRKMLILKPQGVGV